MRKLVAVVLVLLSLGLFAGSALAENDSLIPVLSVKEKPTK